MSREEGPRTIESLVIEALKNVGDVTTLIAFDKNGNACTFYVDTQDRPANIGKISAVVFEEEPEKAVTMRVRFGWLGKFPLPLPSPIALEGIPIPDVLCPTRRTG